MRFLERIGLAATARAVLVLLGPALLAPACAHDYVVEDRDTPVHVWITAPDLEASGGTLTALVYVGGQKVVEGTITFHAGKPTVVLPSVHLKAGTVMVTAVLFDGTVSENERVAITQESWVQVLVRAKTATIQVTEQQPSVRGR